MESNEVTKAAAPAISRSDWMLRVSAATGGAAALSILAPPHNVHWLHWVVYLPMLWAIRPGARRFNIGLSWWYGIVGVGLLFWWIVETITIFSPFIPMPGAVAILGLFSAAFGAPYVLLWPAVHPLRRRLGAGWVLALPALQVVIEWLSMSLLLFPYNHGVSQYRVPLTWQLASVTGVWGLTYLVFLVNCALAEVMYRRQEGRAFPLGTVSGAAATLSAVVLFGAWRFERVEAILAEAETVSLLQLQTSKGMEERMFESPRTAFDEWVTLTEAAPPGTDLVVWPEGACAYTLNANDDRPNLAQVRLSKLAKDKGVELVVGGGSRTREADESMGELRTRVFNSVYWFGSDGEVVGRYDKMVPLPFGEYLPFGEWLPGLADALAIGDFKAGEEAIVFDTAVGRAASPICYEAILPGVVRRFRDVELLITVTNDAWFGDTANPHQHAMLAAVRATELGTPVVRTAYTGISMVVEPHGVIHHETEPFTDVARVVTFRNSHVPTLFGRLGNWFVWLCLLGLAAAWGATRSRATPPG